MRSNIDIDDTLLAEAMAIFKLDTRKATIEDAFRRAIAGERRRQAIKDMAGLGWDGDLEAMREGRTFPPTR